MITARPHQIFKNLSEKLVIKFHWPYLRHYNCLLGAVILVSAAICEVNN